MKTFLDWRRLWATCLLALLVLPLAAASADTTGTRVRLVTTAGDIVIRLFDDTPLHRDNFIKLVREGYYDGLIFHRVVERFVIQAGDSATRHALPEVRYGEGDLGYTLPAEIRFPEHPHLRGAVGMAREADDVNPEARSSAAQFYIVWGVTCSEQTLAKVKANLEEATGGEVTFPYEVRQDYLRRGGAPHLDGRYTVFGEVVDGLMTVEDIQAVRTDRHQRPLVDVRIIKAEVLTAPPGEQP